MDSILQIAMGTAAGILAAVTIVAIAWRWYRLWEHSQGRHRATREAVVVAMCLAIAVTLPEGYRWAMEQHQRALATAAAARQEADEVGHCRARKDEIIRRAVAPLTEPIDAMGINRIRSEYSSRKFGWSGDIHWDRSEHGWLVLCRNRGVISKTEYDDAIALQHSNQAAFDQPELERRARRRDELNRVILGGSK